MLVIDDDRRSSQCSVAPEEKQPYGDHAHHHEPPVSLAFPCVMRASKVEFPNEPKFVANSTTFAVARKSGRIGKLILPSSASALANTCRRCARTAFPRLRTLLG